jgi:EamA domain-containing membrane protein RarD
VCRGVVLAVTSATLAIAAHRLAGGALPDTGLTIVLTFGVAGIGITMADKQRSASAILAVLGAAQLATHLLLSVQTMDMPGMGSGAMPYGTSMIGTHVVAVLITTALLTRADAAVFAVAAALARLLPVLVAAPPVPAAPARPRPRVAPLARPTSVLLCRDNARRGPPVCA